MTDVRDPKVSYRTADGWVDALTGVLTPDLGFPTATTVGVDAIPGWTPTTTITDDNLHILDEGTVIEDLRLVNGALILSGAHCVVRRCEFINSSVTTEYGDFCGNGALFEDCTVRADPPGTSLPLNFSFGVAGYTCRRCSIIDTGEGWRSGGSGFTLADPDMADPRRIRLYDCYCSITAGAECTGPESDYHGDGLQCYDAEAGGVPMTIRNTVIDCQNHLIPDCLASAGVGAGVAESDEMDIDGLILSGLAAAQFHQDCGGDTRHLYIVDNSWVFDPVSIDEAGWTRMHEWQAYIIDGVTGAGQPGTITATIPFGYPGFGPMDPPP